MEINPYSYEFHEDPYPIYRWLRDESPVHHNEELDFWALSRYEDVLNAHRDHERFSSAQGVSLELMGPETAPMREALPMMIMMDPPRQTRLRKLVNRVFTPRAVSGLEPEIRRLAVGLLERFVEEGRGDFVRQFSALLPVEVISTILGIPAEDRTMVRERVDASLHREADTPHPPPSAIDAMVEAVGYYCSLVAERRKRPREDMLSGLVEATTEGEDGSVERLSDEEIVGFCGLLAGAGSETVTKLLANGVVLFSRHPEQRAKVVEDPARIPDAVEEILRIMPPSQLQGRWTTRDVELHGTTIPAESKVALLTGAATRDEREFDRPDEFDMDRPAHLALGFGYGIHACLGAALARLEARVSLEELHRRIPDYEVDESGLERVHMSNVHGFSGVPMSWREAPVTPRASEA